MVQHIDRLCNRECRYCTRKLGNNHHGTQLADMLHTPFGTSPCVHHIMWQMGSQIGRVSGTSAGSLVSPSPRAEESKRVSKSVQLLVKLPTNINHDHSQVDDSPLNRPEPRCSSIEPCSPIPNSRNSDNWLRRSLKKI